MKKLNIIAIMSAAVLMNSCGLYNKYERPDVATDNIMRDAGQYANTTDTISFGDVEWREVFIDPQLQALIQQGLDKNHDLLNAALDVKMAEAQLMTARLAFLPSFAFTPSGTLSKVLEHGTEWSKAYALPVNASWNADLFGNLLSQNRSSKVALIATQDYQQAVRSRVICGIANCYYTLLMLDRQYEILVEMEKLTKDTWDMMKLRKELSGARETSVLSSEASYLNVKAQVVDMRRQIHETENTLSLLTGQQAQSVTRGKLYDQNLPSTFSAGIPVNMLANRPDIHAAEMSLAGCFYNVQTARSAFYPALNFTATGSFTNSAAQIVNPGQFLARFVGSLTQPIFQNGKLVAGLKVAKAQYEKAYNTWEQAILAAGSEVSDALVQYNSSDEKGKIDRQQVEVLKKNVSHTRDLFKMGSSTYLEVITAQSQLLNAEISQVTDDFNKMQAVVSLYSALGGGRK